MNSKWMRNLMSAGVLAAAVVATGCQPGEEEEPVPPGAVPAAPDVRPGTEAAPGGVALPGAETDSIAGAPREMPEDAPESAEQNAP